MSEQMYRLPEVERAIGLKRSTIYAMIADGTFPKPVQLGKRAVGWPEATVRKWLKNRLIASGTVL